jgi:hypothetical protein
MAVAMGKRPGSEPEAKKSKSGNGDDAKLFVMTIKDKGGSGASTLAEWVSEAYARSGTPVHMVDGDGTTASLFRHYSARSEKQGVANPVQTFSLHGSIADRDSIARLLDVPAKIVLLDLPATSLTVLRKIERDYSWTAGLQEFGWRPVILTSISPGVQSVFNLADVMDMFEDRADYVTAMNLGLGSGRDDERSRARDFRCWLSSRTRDRFLGLGGVEFDFPMLDKGILADIADAGSTFEDGSRLDALDFVDRMYLSKWFSATDRLFAPARKKLGL